MASDDSGNFEVDYVEKCPRCRYIRFKDVLGKGASKTVYKAFDQVEGIEVAWSRIKIDGALKSPEKLEKLYSEVDLVGQLNHQNIIKCYDSWIDEKKNTINMITELCTSGSLRQYRKKHKTVDIKVIKNWARQILRGLDYLHRKNPPIIHRDLKCDNLFVNGNQGEVKIGDLGLAIILQPHTVESVFGTPGFMAPELYDEKYNELVDVYSFGMCLLEMMTLEYPYSECENAAQIYRKVSTGVKPASLNKIACAEVREFIEKCLVPSSQRLCAKELLEDHFLRLELSKLPPCLQLWMPEEAPISNYGSHHMDMDHECSQFVCTDSKIGSCASSVLVFQRLHLDSEFRLKGWKNDDNTISLTLRIANRGGQVQNIQFVFYLDSDTAFDVAMEMVEQLDLTLHDVAFIADFINFIIMGILPGWKPSYDCHSRQERSTSGLMADQWETHLAISPTEVTTKSNSPHSIHLDSDFASRYATFTLSPGTPRTSEVSGGDSTRNKEMPKDSSGEVCPKEFGNLYHNEGSMPAFDNSKVAKVPSLNTFCPNRESELKLELDAIDKQYQQWFQELSVMKQKAIEATKMRWMTRK